MYTTADVVRYPVAKTGGTVGLEKKEGKSKTCCVLLQQTIRDEYTASANNVLPFVLCSKFAAAVARLVSLALDRVSSSLPIYCCYEKTPAVVCVFSIAVFILNSVIRQICLFPKASKCNCQLFLLIVPAS